MASKQCRPQFLSSAASKASGAYLQVEISFHGAGGSPAGSETAFFGARELVDWKLYKDFHYYAWP